MAFYQISLVIVVIMSIYSDTRWMYSRIEDGYLSASSKTSVDYFLDVAFSNEAIVDKDFIKCPCIKCKNIPYRRKDDSNLLVQDDELDGCTCMVTDAMCSTDNFTFNQQEQVPNPYVKGFYDMLRDVDKPLWVGCQNYSELQAASELLNRKSEYNIYEVGFDHLLPMIKWMLPPSEKLVGNFYETNKLLKILALIDKKIHAWKNHCMLYYGIDSNLIECRVCSHDRYKSDRLSLVPYYRM
uniref:Transposase-associated domain-containing protein n=1 Tax=Lactuca sativa TaxID=4236 RepID=A0A9R1X420_LACSA|nr:hypothetical protein LSAT_V11C700367840 [Lactuca sativa]